MRLKLSVVDGFRKYVLEQLTACPSVKFCRLFLVFADKHQHRWRKDLDTSRIDCGSGPRALTVGGKLHPTYLFYVPETLVPEKLATADGDA